MLLEKDQDLKNFEQLILNLKNKYTIQLVEKDIYNIKPKKIKTDTKKIAIVALTHGDEIIGLHIFNEFLLNLLEDRFKLEGELYLIIANRDAYLKNQRYIDIDLNRVYSFKKDSSKRLEEKRVQKIKPIIDICDYIIDIHQSIENTLTPFFILPFTQDAFYWTRIIAPNIPIVKKPLSKKILTLSAYGISKGKKAVTFEVGGNGKDLYQLELGLRVIEQFIKYTNYRNLSIKSHPLRNYSSVYDLKYFQPYTCGKVTFFKKFRNFESIKKGQIIAYIDKVPIKSPIEGKILLYPQKWFKKDSKVKADGLFFIMQNTKIHLNF